MHRERGPPRLFSRFVSREPAAEPPYHRDQHRQANHGDRVACPVEVTFQQLRELRPAIPDQAGCDHGEQGEPSNELAESPS